MIFTILEYAAAQHEHTEWHHDVGEAKYIEKPLMVFGMGDMPRTIAQKLLAELGRHIHVNR
jgi:hypothetical protein